MSEKAVRFNGLFCICVRCDKRGMGTLWNKPVAAETPILIAGPTASGKSALALDLAVRDGRAIVNADALQVFDCWRVLSARPSDADEAEASHLLYGHVAFDASYSVGDWLREVAPLLALRPAPIIVGGTGLYFRALTEGLAEIPATPSEIRKEGNARVASDGHDTLLPEIDEATRALIDVLNPARVQRAWEVQKTTGQGLAAWQAKTPPPLLRLSNAVALVLDADKAWLLDRVTQRFDLMIKHGALDEARAVEPFWDPARPAAKAIGSPELIAHLRGEMTIDDARDAAIIATRQYAKRQRTWFRARMRNWEWITTPA